jgi:molecular chaperone DnaK
VEKILKDNDEKLPDDVKSEVQADLDALKSALAGEDEDAVKKAVETLSQSQTKLGEALYQADAENAEPAAEASDSNDEDIVDAEVVEEEQDDTADKK